MLFQNLWLPQLKWKFKNTCMIIQLPVHRFKFRYLHFQLFPYVPSFTNKRPMGHMAHLWKQFKSINTCWLKEEKNQYLLYDNWMVLNLTKLECPSHKDALSQVWLKLAQWFWWRRFLLLPNYLPLEIGRGPSFNSSSKGEDFKTLSMYFPYFIIIYPWKSGWPFIWINLNSL